MIYPATVEQIFEPQRAKRSRDPSLEPFRCSGSGSIGQTQFKFSMNNRRCPQPQIKVTPAQWFMCRLKIHGAHYANQVQTIQIMEAQVRIVCVFARLASRAGLNKNYLVTFQQFTAGCHTAQTAKSQVNRKGKYFKHFTAETAWYYRKLGRFYGVFVNYKN